MNILGSDSAPKYLCNAAQVDVNEEMSFNSLYQSSRISLSQAFKLDFKNRMKQRCEMIWYCLQGAISKHDTCSTCAVLWFVAGTKWKYSLAYSIWKTARKWCWKTPCVKGIIKLILNTADSKGQRKSQADCSRIYPVPQPRVLLPLSDAFMGYMSSSPTPAPVTGVSLKEYLGNRNSTESIF